MSRHKHSRFLCWVGLHPACCCEIRGLMATMMLCHACDRAGLYV